MDNRGFFIIVLMMFAFPFLSSCEKMEKEVETLPVLNAENIREEVYVKEDGKFAQSDISEAASCLREEYPIRYTEHFSSETHPDDIPEYSDIVYYNSSLGCDLVTKGKLVEKGIDESNTWVETIKCELVFIAENPDNVIWRTDSETFEGLSLYDDEPVWDGYEKDVLETAGYSIMGYKIENASWSGDVSKDEPYERKAVYTLKRTNKGYYGIYEGTAYDIREKGELSFSKNEEDMKLLSEYRTRNSDVYGIVRIDGTGINHPVMKCVSDEGYYLFRDLDKKYNTHGVPFIGKESDFERVRGNTVIYGHKTYDGDVFGELYKYEDVVYCKEHPIIETVSENGTQKWMVIACYLVCNNDADAFDYSDENAFMSLDGFTEYMDNVKKRNFYVSDKRFGINDSYLTLSSCSRENTGEGTNRMAVLAVRISNDFDVTDFVGSLEKNPSPYLPEKMRDKD